MAIPNARFLALLDKELTRKDLGALSAKYPRKNWKVIFIHDFQFTEAELEHALYDNQGKTDCKK